MKFTTRVLAAAVLFAAAAVAQAQTVRIANQGDALSMDPHSLNESLQALAYAALGQQGPQVRRRRSTG